MQLVLAGQDNAATRSPWARGNTEPEVQPVADSVYATPAPTAMQKVGVGHEMTVGPWVPIGTPGDHAGARVVEAVEVAALGL